MANNRRNADPAEGSQDTIERELQNRDEDNKPSTSPSQAEENRSGAADVKEERVRRRAYEIWESHARAPFSLEPGREQVDQGAP